MIAIIATNNIKFIGKDNKLLWESTDDLKHFKAMRQGKKLLVGVNTWNELPPFLKKLCIVDQRSMYGEGNLLVENDGLDTLEMDEILCIGGKKTYEKYAPYFTELHISHINDNSIGDCTFPDLSNLNPDCKIYNYNFEVNG